MTALARLFGPWVLELDGRTLRVDALAGLLGAVLVLPQAIAFAALVGLPPSYALATAVLPCIVAALFGSSRHVMSGPTNANSLAIVAMLAPLAVVGSPEYIQLVLAVTVLVGLMQLAIGALRLGTLAHFISPAALRGFTGGAALLIAVHALDDLLGIDLPPGRSAIDVLLLLFERAAQFNPAALVVGAGTIAAALLLKRLWPRGPHMLAGVIAGAVVAALLARASLGGQPVEVVGHVPEAWPRWQLPDVDWRRLPELAGLAIALTIVSLGQSFSIAKVLASRSGQHVDANREFVGQGLSNVVGGFFSCYLSCGSLNRSIPNLEVGARTPLAAVFSALWLLALVAVSATLLAAIPMAAVSGLLLLVAWSLLDLPDWRRLLRLSGLEFGIALATLVATLAIRLELAILFGTLLSLAAYLWRTARPAMRTMGFDTPASPGRLEGEHRSARAQRTPEDAVRPFVIVDDNPDALPECPQLKLLRMEGSVYFGATQHVSERLHALRTRPQPLKEPRAAPEFLDPRGGRAGPQPGPGGVQKHLLVMAKSMNFIDLAGDDLWRDELHARRRIGGDLYFHRPRPPVTELWNKTGFLDEMGRDHVFPDKRIAIATIVPRLDMEICARCTVKLFDECPR
ncbi:MAG: SulP family inorganic anion transporter [Burkholderiaceae bacterium]|nr:SulP family inorganic anion transporter [Burkholderiaceae bacterium]